MHSILAFLLAAVVVGPGEFGPGDGGSTVPVIVGAAVACNDGIDNDGDGNVDLADTGCVDGTDTSELRIPIGMSESGTITIAADLGAHLQSDEGPWRAVHWDARDAISTSTFTDADADVHETGDMRRMQCFWSFGSSMGSSPLAFSANNIPANEHWGRCNTIASTHYAPLGGGSVTDDVYVVVVDENGYKVGGPYTITTTDLVDVVADSESVCVSIDGTYPNCPAGVTDKQQHAGGDFDAMCNTEFVTNGNELVIVEPGAWTATEDCNDVDSDHFLIGVGTWDATDVNKSITVVGDTASVTVIRGTSSHAGRQNIRVQNFAMRSTEAEVSGTRQTHQAVSLGNGNDNVVMAEIHAIGLGSLGSCGAGGAVNDDYCQYPAVINSTLKEPNCSSTGTDTGPNGFWLESFAWMVIGSEIDRGCSTVNSTSTDPATDSLWEHSWRSQDPDLAVFRGSSCRSQGHSKHCLALRGDQLNADSDSIGASIVDSLLGGYVDDDQGSIMIQFGPQNDAPSTGLEAIDHWLFEGNLVHAQSTDPKEPGQIFWFSGKSITVRNNLLIWQLTTDPPSASRYWHNFKRDSRLPDLGDVEIAYNTTYTADTSSDTIDIVSLLDCGSETDSNVANNLLISDSATTFDTITGTCSTNTDNDFVAESAVTSVVDLDFADYHLISAPSPAVGVFGKVPYDVDGNPVTNTLGFSQP